MKPIHVLLALGTLVSSATGFAQSVAIPESTPGVLARAGEAQFGADEFKDIFDQINPAARKALADNPAVLNQTVRSLIVERLILAEALEKGWDKEKDVTEMIEKAKEKVIVQSYLASVAQPPEGSPSESDVRAVYEANRAQLQMPKQFRLAQIFVARPGPGSDVNLAAAKSKVDGVTAALKKPRANFEGVARAMSEEPVSAGNGGEIGWLTAAQIRPEIRDAVMSLKKGEQSEVIEVPEGWHVVKVLEIKPPSAVPFEEVKDVLANQIRNQQWEARRQAYLTKLLQDNPIAVNELGLAKAIDEHESKP